MENDSTAGKAEHWLCFINGTASSSWSTITMKCVFFLFFFLSVFFFFSFSFCLFSFLFLSVFFLFFKGQGVGQGGRVYVLIWYCSLSFISVHSTERKDLTARQCTLQQFSGLQNSVCPNCKSQTGHHRTTNMWSEWLSDLPKIYNPQLQVSNQTSQDN